MNATIEDFKDRIVTGDALDVLKNIPSGTIDLIVTSPPYYKQRDYGPGSRIIGNEEELGEYLKNLLEIVLECERVTKKTGSIIFNIGDKYDSNGSLMLIPQKFAISVLEASKLSLINDIMWLKQNPQPRQFKRRLVSSHESFFHFIKDPHYKYHIDQFESEPNGKKNKTTAGKNIGQGYFELIDKSELTEQEKENARKELSQVIEEVKSGKISSLRMKIRGIHSEAYGGYEGGRKMHLETKGYTIIRMPGGTMRRDAIITPKAFNRDTRHPAVFPEKVIEQLVRLTTDPNDVVLDPFSGSGTTAVVSRNLKRHYIGIEINSKYSNMALDRLNKMENSQYTFENYSAEDNYNNAMVTDQQKEEVGLMSGEDDSSGSRLEIYENKSILRLGEGNTITFEEGKQTEESLKRYEKIKKSLENGFLDDVISECENPSIRIELPSEMDSVITNLVTGITSEIGRAISGLSIIQLCIKAICPEQSIRLHKGGNGDFSWKEGISMRSLDRTLIAPILRKRNLLMYNRDGVMMTRSLAENYPYSKFYKAALRGPKKEWIELLDAVELNEVSPIMALKKIIVLLINRSEEFERLSNETVAKCEEYINKSSDPNSIRGLIKTHFEGSQYPARLFEISVHSLFQAAVEIGITSLILRPLSQMRSANKKAGNIGDVELLKGDYEDDSISEAYDCKYGKSYLFDELVELSTKMKLHPELDRVAFVVNSNYDSRKEVKDKIEEIHDEYGTDVAILTFDELVDSLFRKPGIDKSSFSKMWLKAYTESLCLKRQLMAPIEEPAEEWVKGLNALF